MFYYLVADDKVVRYRLVRSPRAADLRFIASLRLRSTLPLSTENDGMISNKYERTVWFLTESGGY